MFPFELSWIVVTWNCGRFCYNFDIFVPGKGLKKTCFLKISHKQERQRSYDKRQPHGARTIWLLCINYNYFGFLPKMAILGIWICVKHWFWVNSHSWTAFIFYAPCTSDFIIWPNFGVVFHFLESQWALFWTGERLKNVFLVYSYT